MTEREDCTESLFHQRAQASMYADSERERREKNNERERVAERRRAAVEEVEQVEKKGEMGPEEGDEEEQEQEDFTRRVEEFPHAREVVRQRERRWRGKGETCCGGRRRGKGGGERERESFSHHAEVPQAREVSREREVEKGEKTWRRRGELTRCSFSPVDCPRPLLPPRDARKSRTLKLLTEAPKISQQLAMID